MKEIKRGTKVLIRVTIVGRACDSRPEDEKGYIIETINRGSRAFVNPEDIYVQLKESE